ncbi:uncharacterized protein PV09_06548 [Verruconis gallopava]|uniref:Uncharacterized protein n=1 Tax=Verruconis gallopava TaxID=253628 RepID=A0A0D1XIC3_9PEZI|nr:uncharacterized protein PV09_06548 [Verruconis gallopava]KIW02046.1 hypothetical protein PV09_06548 [Verruconis gallopava]
MKKDEESADKMNVADEKLELSCETSDIAVEKSIKSPLSFNVDGKTDYQKDDIANSFAAVQENVCRVTPENDLQDNATEIHSEAVIPNDPMALAQHKKLDITTKKLKEEFPTAKPRKLKNFYSKQNQLIDQFLQSGDEERLSALDLETNGPKIKTAVYGSATVNFCLFVIQIYAAIATGSLSLFATAADAFMDLVSSIVMMVTSRMARRPSVYKYPIGRTRIETVGIILFCALMTTVAVQLIVESSRALGEGKRTDSTLELVPLICVGVAIFSKFSLMLYCFFLRRYPACYVFFIDHRNDIVVNSFGLVMSIIGTRLVWYIDPIGAILIALLILFSWASTAYEQIWLLVGKSAPREFLSKVLYVSMTHDEQIKSIDTCRAYHAGEKYFVEIDIIMDENTILKVTHDVSQTLQRKIEGLEDVERAFVHVDYDQEHDPYEEHKPLYPKIRSKSRIKVVLSQIRQRISMVRG